MIVGAGLAGLITAHAFPNMPIIEAMPEPREVHKALLRFRSRAVADLVGVEFREVTVRKGIWDGYWREPNITSANAYALKVTGKLLDRSIWNLAPAQRFIAPPDLYRRLLSAAAPRITWGVKAQYGCGRDAAHIINTAPLPVVLEALGIEHEEKFERAAIRVERIRVKGADVYQTVYFPSPATTLYRASMTGDMLICEFAGEPSEGWLTDVCDAFALRGGCSLEFLESVEQKYGKIVPIDEEARRRFIVTLTRQHNIFSIGRFATWRNILLDDVVHDASVVKRLINASAYDQNIDLARIIK
jgi:hypothetical protein